MLQGGRITDRWVRRHVRLDSAPPPGGAILLTLHHRGERLGLLALRRCGARLASIHDPATDLPARPDDAPRAHYYRQIALLRCRIFEGRIFAPREAGRKGLRFLDAGGYLVITADVFGPTAGPHAGQTAAVLGRAVAIPRGPAWFGLHSGKPIVPWVVVPQRSGWRVWIGEAIPPTRDAVAAALTECIRRAPASWDPAFAEFWLAAPPVA
jgi:hypothetical protein